MAPENFDGDATTDRLDPTWKAQVDLLDPTRRSNRCQCQNISTFIAWQRDDRQIPCDGIYCDIHSRTAKTKQNIQYLCNTCERITNSRFKICWFNSTTVKCNNCLELWHIISKVRTERVLYNVCNTNHNKVHLSKRYVVSSDLSRSTAVDLAVVFTLLRPL